MVTGRMFLSKSFHIIGLSMLILMAVDLPSKAQDIPEYNFTCLTKQDGLSHNDITGIGQDSTGFIWISTRAGLNRFNGSNFVQFHSGNDSLTLPEEYQAGIVWLDQHRLVTYSGGLFILDTRTGESRNLFVPYCDKQYQYKFNSVLAVSGNEEGEIFVLTRSGFYHFDRDYHLVFRYDHYSTEEVATHTFGFGRYLMQLDKRRFVIAAIDGLYLYNVTSRDFTKMVPADCPLLTPFLDYPKKDYQFFQQRPGRLVISTPDTDSLFYIQVAENKRTASHVPTHLVQDEFDYRSVLAAISDTLMYITGKISGFYKLRLFPDDGRIVLYPEKFFPHHRCSRIIQDRDHTLWIGTNNGLFRQNNSRSDIRQVSIPPQVEAAFPNISIAHIYMSGDNMFVSTKGDAGLLIYDKEQLRYLNRIDFAAYGKHANSVYSVISAGDNSLLVGTYGPLFRLNPVTGSKTVVPLDKWDRVKDWTADLFKDRQDNIWICSENLYKYDGARRTFSLIPPGEKPFDKVVDATCLGADADGNIWVGGHGLLRYNIQTRTFDRRIYSFPYIKMPDKEIVSFLGDRRNNLWINSYNNGLVCYNVDRGTSHLFTKEDGLPDNNIASMTIIGNKLWLATFSGIACLDLQTYRITHFGTEDGFPDGTIGKGSKFYYDIPRNKLYIGFTNMIVQFDPDIIFQKSPAPSLFIESLTTGDQKKYLFPADEITSGWRNNEITVSIGAINYFTSNTQRYAYRLLKDDSSQWQQLGNQNTFSISNLSPGHYRVQVKLFSISNRWPALIKEIDITITPPFWKQLWFLTLMVILLCLSIYGLLKWRTGLIRRNERAKTHIQALKAEEYKNQLELEHISNYFSSSLAGKKDVDEILWDVMKNLIGRMNHVDCIIYMWNEDKTKMVQKAAYGPKGTPKAIMDAAFDVLPGQGVVGHVMLTREALLVPNTREDSRYRVDDMMRLSELCVPILHNDELIGVIDSEHHSPNFYNEMDVKILATIANLVGNKIKQIESEQSLEKKQKEIASINQQLAEAQLSALQTQMNPHFIFNSLNSIKGMILDNEQQKASRYLSKFANMIRTTLDQSKEIFTTVHENIEHLESYLVMEKLRFDDSFTFRITADEHIDKEETLIPTLMIQPLAENAIWHGLMTTAGRKKLSIHFSQEADSISCTIEDNGIGINRSEQLKQSKRPTHRSVGLSNLRNRIKILNEKYDTGCTLEITDLQDLNKDKTGTTVVLRFNIILHKP
jgi:ligand-binding sensor domain-containing protein